MERAFSRLEASIEKRGVNECWPFKKSVGSHGYGQLGWWENGKSHVMLAHRMVFIQTKGPIPDGMTVDHICHNRICCNPNHLRLLTNHDNATDNNFKKIRDTIMTTYGHHDTRLIHKQKGLV